MADHAVGFVTPANFASEKPHQSDASGAFFLWGKEYIRKKLSTSLMLKMKTESKNPALEAALRMKDRQVADLEIAISEFEHSASLLDRQIRAEECRTGITDPTNPAYSSFAKSAIQRRNNLRASATSLKVWFEATLQQLRRLNIPYQPE